LALDGVKISSGFPSPAAGYDDKRLDINDYLVRNPVSTFLFPDHGDAMEGTEIFEGDVLVVGKLSGWPYAGLRAGRLQQLLGVHTIFRIAT